MAVNWNEVQDKWQKRWAEAGLGTAKVQKGKPKFFMIFAYPGISGFLHVGHMRGFSYTDAICRYERMQGKEVLFPVGTHASGNQAIAFANKVKNKDQEWWDYLRRNGCPEKKIGQLTDPKKIVEYFNEVYINDYWKKFGFLCDWDRFTCTIWPDYEKFIQWQFKKLQQRNLLAQKPYFATACIKCGPVAVDPSETDISKGGQAEKVEYTLLKFKIGNEYLVAATLRPETVFGQTNLWVNPTAKYVVVEVENEAENKAENEKKKKGEGKIRRTEGRERWIISEEAANKLQFQKEDILLKEDVDIKKYIGRLVLAPGANREIPILPAPFCDPKIGTGIVTSVPSDAPYDYLALRQLQKSPQECEKWGLSPSSIKSIQLIPIITTRGYGKFPAQEIVENNNITSFDDPRLEKENKELYKAGHHTGVMSAACGRYAGKRVEEAKELIKAELLGEGKADVMHDLDQEVICRCGNPVVIQRIDDQWFIRYSDQELTEKSKYHAATMRVFPEEYQKNLPSVLDWFNDRACARLGNWLGSKFPFDQKWTVEPISDSTLYPAYYIVSKYVQGGSLKADELTEEFFDYVFLGKGKPQEGWKPVKEEFDYFYPLDLNLGGKEHQTVHFPVFIMNHIGILPEKAWPRGIMVNWWVIGKGSKISKSKGGAEPIPQAIEKYGVDAMRLYYAHIGSPHVDVVWEEQTVLNYKQALERIYAIIEELRQPKKQKSRQSSLDAWLLSRLHRSITKASQAMESYNLRDLASAAYFTLYDDCRWYLRRGGGHPATIQKVIETWAKLLCPITPHLSEELWTITQGKSSALVSQASWPQAEEQLISGSTEAQEQLLQNTIHSLRTVIELAKLQKPKEITIFIAEEWLYELFSLLVKELQVTRNLGEIMKRVLQQEKLKMRGKEISKIVPALLKDTSKIPLMITSQKEEFQAISEALVFLEKEFAAKITLRRAEESDDPKARSAWPGKVGIVVK